MIDDGNGNLDELREQIEILRAEMEQLQARVAAIGESEDTKGLGAKHDASRTTYELRLLQLRVDELYRRVDQVTAAEADDVVSAAVLVKLTSNADGGGWYNGNIWDAPGSSPAGDETLAEEDAGSEGDAILVCNLAEVTKDTHDIKFTGSPTPYQFIFTGVLVTPTSGDPFVAIYAAQWGCG